MIGNIFAEHPWLGPLAWQSTLCLAAGLGGSFLLRRRAVRAHQVLLLGLVAAVLIPALTQIVKQNQWGLLVAERAVATPAHHPAAAPAEFAIPDEPIATELANVPQPTGVREAVPAPTKTRFDWTRAVLPAWLAISSILLLRLVIQFLLGRRLAKRSEVVDNVQLLQLIESVEGKLGLRADVKVRASARVRSPVIWCWGRRPVLLVPPESRSDEGLDWPSILCHELAHAKRRDHVTGLLAELLVCALPWQPLLWWARQRLAALSEEACDDWVIACGQRATGYARTLLGLTPQAQAALLPGVVTSRRGLAGRVRRILEDGCGNPRPGLRWTFAAVVFAGCASLGLAFTQTRPALPNPSVADVQPQAQAPAAPSEKPTAEGEKILLRLVDPNGRPVAGAQVGPHVEVHELPMLNRRLEWPLASTSDENGQVAIETKALFWSPAQQDETSTSTVYALHEKRGIGAVQEIARADSGKVRTIVLRPVCRVHGMVRSTALEAKGIPLRWASLDVGRKDGTPVLECSFERDNHSFEFSLPPGDYWLKSGGTAGKVRNPMSIFTLTEFTRLTITVTEGQRDLDLGVIDLHPTKVSALIGRPAPEIGPVKAWRSGLGVTLAGLKGRLVWLHLGGRDPDVGGDMARLVELCEAQDFRGLTIVAIFGCDSLEELRQRWAAAYQKAGGAQTVPFYVGVDGGATRATYGITRGQDVLIDPAGNVVGVPSTLFAKEAVSSILGTGGKGPLPAWRKQFDEVYFIDSHEVLKRIAPPYIAERLDYYREKYPGSAERIPRGPDRMVLTWNGALKDWGMGYGPANWLSTILTTVLELRSYEYDGPQELLNLWLPGDWIVRREAPREAKLRALEELVAHELARKIRFEQRSVPREALVVTGRFQFHPIAPLVGTRGEAFVHFYTAAADLDESTGGGGTALSVRQFLEVLGDHVQMPMVDQTESSVLDEILYRYHTSSSHVSRIRDPQEKAAELKTLLDNVSAQTELQFEIRREPVPVWFVTE